jgi:hypothetical protein
MRDALQHWRIFLGNSMQTLLHGINKSINKEEEMYVNRKGELKLPSLNNTDTIIEAEVQIMATTNRKNKPKA